MEILFTVIIILVSFGLPAAFLISMGKAKAKYRHIQQKGLNASGTILALHETGLRVNDNPEVEFTVRAVPDNGAPSFETKIKHVISILEIPNIQPGTQVYIKYDPKEPGFAAFAPKEPESSLQPSKEAQAELVDQLKQNDDLNATGVPAMAIVKEFIDRNIFINGNNKAATLKVKVIPQGTDAFDSLLHGVFMPEGLYKYQPGREIPVKYDPQNLSVVSVDYSRSSVERVD